MRYRYNADNNSRQSNPDENPEKNLLRRGQRTRQTQGFLPSLVDRRFFETVNYPRLWGSQRDGRHRWLSNWDMFKIFLSWFVNFWRRTKKILDLSWGFLELRKVQQKDHTIVTAFPTSLDNIHLCCVSRPYHRFWVRSCPGTNAYYHTHTNHERFFEIKCAIRHPTNSDFTLQNIKHHKQHKIV